MENRAIAGFDFGLRNVDLQEKAGIINVITRRPGYVIRPSS